MPRPPRGLSFDFAQYKPYEPGGYMACTGRNLKFGRAAVTVAAERGVRPHPKFLPPIFRHRRGSVVAARRRRALLSPQDISTTSLLTIPGAVEAHGLGDCSRDPLFQVSCEIAISQQGVAGPPTAPSGSSERVRAPPWLPVSGGYYNEPSGSAVGGRDDQNGRLRFFGAAAPGGLRLPPGTPGSWKWPRNKNITINQ